MKLLNIYMFFMAPYYAWKTKKDTIKEFHIRTPSEILAKKKEFEDRYLLMEKINNEKEKEKFSHYLTVLKWLIGE